LKNVRISKNKTKNSASIAKDSRAIVVFPADEQLSFELVESTFSKGTSIAFGIPGIDPVKDFKLKEAETIAVPAFAVPVYVNQVGEHNAMIRKEIDNADRKSKMLFPTQFIFFCKYDYKPGKI
jgi:hypothetical protein